MRKLTVVRYKDIDVDKWDAFVDESDTAWFWHTSFFQEAWPYGENISFAIVDENNKIILEQSLYLEKRINRIPKMLKKMKLFYRRKNSLKSIGGIAVKNDLTSKQKRRLQRFYVQYIDRIIDEYKIKNFDYCVQATLVKSYLPKVCPLVNPMIFWGYINSISQAYVIDLSKTKDEIYYEFQQTTRNLINRCKKDETIKLVEAKSSKDDLDRYYKLHVQTYTRTGTSPHPKKYFEKIFFNILKNNLCRIVFLYKNDELIAAQNTLFFKDVAMYWTGASLDDKGEGENRLLMFEQIMKAKDMGLKYYEVGEAFPNVRKGKLKGLNDYKKSFGGAIHPIFSGRWNCKN